MGPGSSVLFILLRQRLFIFNTCNEGFKFRKKDDDWILIYIYITEKATEQSWIKIPSVINYLQM